MGSDNLFHKRKERLAKTLQRKKAMIAPYDRVLIVCEGAKTEPEYFKEMRTAFRLSNANIIICGEECGSDPLSVVKYAIDKFKEDPDYNRVYCVIDRDKHATFDAAINKVRHTRLGSKTSIHNIVSIPCFELWLLLHYVYTTRPFCCTSSDCDLVITELRKIYLFQDYNKGNKNIFTKTKDKLNTAIKHAEQLEKNNKATNSNNPSTNIHELVKYLLTLKYVRL